MARPHRILVAIDDSPRAPHVYAQAAELASRIGSSLIVLRAVGLSAPLPKEALTTKPDDVPAILAADAAKEVASLVAAAPTTVVPRVRTETGVAADLICRVAEEEDVDLVVVGAHGYTRLERIVGTTAARVVNNCARSVLVVR